MVSIIFFLTFLLFGIDAWDKGQYRWAVFFFACPVMIGLVALAAWIGNWARCPHGIFGGEKKRRCPRCVEEQHIADLRRDEEQRVAKLRKEEKQRIANLRAEAAQLQRAERERLRALSLRSKRGLLELSGREFEDHVAQLFTKLGYSVKQTPYVNDRGRDAILRKDGHKYVMECKRYDDNSPIGRRALQILVAAKLEERSSRGIFVTTGRFASTAHEYAEANNIELIDGECLTKLMWQVSPHSEADDTVKVMCTICGEVLTFSLSHSDELKSCTNGHTVENNLLKEMESANGAGKRRE